MSHLVVRLGWVDFDLGCSTACQILPGLWGIRQKWPAEWATLWNIQVQVNPNQMHDQIRHPVLWAHLSCPVIKILYLEVINTEALHLFLWVHHYISASPITTLVIQWYKWCVTEKVDMFGHIARAGSANLPSNKLERAWLLCFFIISADWRSAPLSLSGEIYSWCPSVGRNSWEAQNGRSLFRHRRNEISYCVMHQQLYFDSYNWEREREKERGDTSYMVIWWMNSAAFYFFFKEKWQKCYFFI